MGNGCTSWKQLISGSNHDPFQVTLTWRKAMMIDGFDAYFLEFRQQQRFFVVYVGW
jgi:hypothetical protein